MEKEIEEQEAEEIETPDSFEEGLRELNELLKQVQEGREESDGGWY